jgi:threonine dehydrogenase-like Zn-dependent dehydrogenase
LLVLQSVVTRENDIHGSFALAGEYPAILGMIAAGRLRLESLIRPGRRPPRASCGCRSFPKRRSRFFKVILLPNAECWGY